MTTISRVRVGLVGLGRFGRLQAEVLASLPNVELVAACDVRPESFDEVAWGSAAPARYNSYESMLAECDLEAVFIVAPDALHEAMVTLALRRGLHVFVEKPLAETYRAAYALAEAARAAGRLLQVGFLLRYEARHAFLKEQIQAGKLGQLATLRLKRHGSVAWYYSYGHTVHPMLEATIHDIDLCVWYAGTRCQRVYAVDRSLLDREGPVASLAMLEFEGGAVALVDANWLLPAGAPQTTLELGGTIDASLEIIGTQATARIDFLNPSFSMWTASGTAYPELSAWPRIMGTVRGALRDEIVDFVQCVAAGERSRIASLPDALATHAIVEAAIRSAREQRPVMLDEITAQEDE